MTRRDSAWPVGAPCWIDLTASDLPAAKRFYAAVLDWEYQELGAAFNDYAIGQVDGMPAAGLGPVWSPEMGSAWTLYFASENVDVTAEAVTAAGGTILFPPGDVGPMGRMFVAADTSGALFGSWQAGMVFGVAIKDEPQSLSWVELRTQAGKDAELFYGSIFGLGFEDSTTDTRAFSLDGGPALGEITAGQASSTGWILSFGVRDVAASVVAAQANGGTVRSQPAEGPAGLVAEVADPCGVTVRLMQVD